MYTHLAIHLSIYLSYPFMTTQIGKQWALETACNQLVRNAGRNRPLRVAREQLIFAAKALTPPEGGDTTTDRVDQVTVVVDELILGSPEIACTLIACDLWVPRSKNMMFRILSEQPYQPSAKDLVSAFARRSLDENTSADASEWYQSPGDDAITFCNLATFLACRYYLHYVWSRYPDPLPYGWERGLPPWLDEWMERSARLRDRVTPLCS